MGEYEHYLVEKKYDIISRRINVDNDFKKYVTKKTKFLVGGVDNVVRIWHIKNNLYEIPKCKQCGKETKFRKGGGVRKGYNFYCNNSCQMTFINLNRSEKEVSERKEKIKKTCLEKYGTEHYFSSENIKNKKKKTYLDRYGVENPSQLYWVKDKKKKTCLKNHGVENPSQSCEIQSKKTSTTRNKRIVTECGKIFDLDGFEPLAVKELLETHKPENILSHKDIEDYIGKIYYLYNNKKSVYHPDILIKNEKKIIEVKSLYWYNHSLERNLVKKNRCLELGYSFEFWVYDSKGLNKIVY
jgi:flagellar hook protein FlgE